MAVQKRYAEGYTVIELMAVLAIASTLLVVAIPLFRTQVQNARMTAAATDMYSTLASARTEAVGRNYPVKVCIRNEDADGCVANSQWEDGWLTFVDLNDNGALNAGEDILQIHPPLHDEITMRGTELLRNNVTYRPNGRTDFGEAAGTEGIILCDARNYGESSRALIVSMLGKVSILKPEEAEDILGGEQALRGDCLREEDEE